ncbi:acyl-CoA thioesterase [Halobacillus litoralis]|uniref:Acyl-CoA thioesterase n=1 Tax=Halobacillus litoralis TaxID=45668 RepID=A0A845DTC2_9BACI|nr:MULTISPECIES: thioesterase family protein [Halobacillus]MCA1021175.1 acyl-CoA thioesterase [Halobacillus litoralis]MYL20853.1 acyl-CoA thioesterase [Halobacillus litoralis]MYL30894.1 acyl-CoA thioesterase [Halobacillus halophilus]MYL36301.1 acyl-CoA thioesterase [Halobacillus litoralis]
MIYKNTAGIRFSETDMAGHVNNTSYFIYLEEARGKFFRDLFQAQEDTLGRFILASTKCDFISQVYFGQNLLIETTIAEIGTSSFTFAHRVYVEGTDQLAAVSEAVVVHFNYEEQKSEALPAEWRMMLEDYVTKGVNL